MNAIPWKWRGETINGRRLQWATQELEGGCRLISVQAMDESYWERFPLEDDFPERPLKLFRDDKAQAKRRGRKSQGEKTTLGTGRKASDVKR